MTIERTIFDKPSGNIVGLIFATAIVGGSEELVANATLFTDRDAEINFKFARKKSITAEDAKAIANALEEIASAVGEY